MEDTFFAQTPYARHIGMGTIYIYGKWEHASAVMKAHCDYRRMKNAYKDFPVENLLRKPGVPNILTEYYLHGHRTYLMMGK